MGLPVLRVTIDQIVQANHVRALLRDEQPAEQIGHDHGAARNGRQDRGSQSHPQRIDREVFGQTAADAGDDAPLAHAVKLLSV
jgi:hypothetical protein